MDLTGFFSSGTMKRIARIKELTYNKNIDDKEVVERAISCYWLVLEKRNESKTQNGLDNSTK